MSFCRAGADIKALLVLPYVFAAAYGDVPDGVEGVGAVPSRTIFTARIYNAGKVGPATV